MFDLPIKLGDRDDRRPKNVDQLLVYPARKLATDVVIGFVAGHNLLLAL